MFISSGLKFDIKMSLLIKTSYIISVHILMSLVSFLVTQLIFCKYRGHDPKISTTNIIMLSHIIFILAEYIARS